MNEFIDLAFATAKIAAIKDEKAKMIVGGLSLAYNVVQLARFRAMVIELSQICYCIDYQIKLRGGTYTQAEYDTLKECQKQIQECQNHIFKHGVMTAVDCVSLLIDGLNSLNKANN